jgi:RNA polymerase sigma-70 factor (sigma-E family)
VPDDEESFTAWAVARQRALLRSAYLLTLDNGRAEDLVQEALVKVAARWGRLRDQQPEAYARQVIYRDNVSWWRRHRRERLTEAPPDLPVEAGGGRAESRLMLRAALARLTERQRAVLVMRYFDDLSEAETARLLGVAVGTVKSQTNAALRRVRECAPELALLLGEVSL